MYESAFADLKFAVVFVSELAVVAISILLFVFAEKTANPNIQPSKTWNKKRMLSVILRLRDVFLGRVIICGVLVEGFVSDVFVEFEAAEVWRGRLRGLWDGG